MGMAGKLRSSRFFFIAGDSCLDFINTRVMERGNLVDRLLEFTDLMEWLSAAGLLNSGSQAEAVRRWGGTAEGRRTLEAAKAFRERLRRMVEQMVNGKRASGDILDEINRFLGRRNGSLRLVRSRSGFEQTFQPRFDEPMDLLPPIAEAAANLLCYRDPSLIRLCENAPCVLYFYDTTKNHTRRWCSMNACGNRMKAAVHYRRIRKQKKGL